VGSGQRDEGPDVADCGQSLVVHLAVADGQTLARGLVMGAEPAYALSLRPSSNRDRSSPISARMRARTRGAGSGVGWPAAGGGPCHRPSLTITSDRHGVDGIDGTASGPQTGHQQAPGGLDRDGDRIPLLPTSRPRNTPASSMSPNPSSRAGLLRCWPGRWRRTRASTLCRPAAGGMPGIALGGTVVGPLISVSNGASRAR
jgi:hypothetical protein